MINVEVLQDIVWTLLLILAILVLSGMILVCVSKFILMITDVYKILK